MSAICTGSRVWATRPTAPSPFRGRVSRTCSTYASGRSRLTRKGPRVKIPKGRVPGRVRRDIGGEVEILLNHTVHGTPETAKKAPGAAPDCFEHWLNVSGRLADHPQDLARCGLTVQCLLRLVEEPHVLNRN